MSKRVATNSDAGAPVLARTRIAFAPDASVAPRTAAASSDVRHGACVLVVKAAPAVEYGAVTGEMKAFNAYQKLRVEHMNRKQVGPRKKAAEEKAAAEKEKAK